jgi:CheY-like chemotaxis protein
MPRRTILFVDDNALIRRLYVELLREEGFEVIEASNGLDALRAVERLDGDCLLILDEEMPRLRGHEVLERLVHRPDANRFRAVIISGSGAPHSFLPASTRKCVVAVVEKPFTAGELMDTVHRLAA